MLYAVINLSFSITTVTPPLSIIFSNSFLILSISSITFLVAFLTGCGSNSCFFFSSNLSYSAAFNSISFFGNAVGWSHNCQNGDENPESFMDM